MQINPDDWIEANASDILEITRLKIEQLRATVSNPSDETHIYALPGVDLHVCGVQADIALQLTRAFHHLRIQHPRDNVQKMQWNLAKTNTDNPNFTLPPPSLPLDAYGLFQQGPDGTILIERRKGMVTAFHAPSLTFHTVVLDENLVENDFMAKPLFRFLTGWMHSQGTSIIHAALLGVNNQGVLVTGRGGSGKSTISIAALQAGMAFASDDLVAIKHKSKHPIGHSIFGSALLTDWSAKLLSTESFDLRKPPPLSLDKLFLPAASLFKGQLKRTMNIVAIARPVFSECETSRLEPVSKGAIYRALAPTSIFTSPWREKNRIDVLFDLVSSLPTYVLHSGTDHNQRAEPIRQLLSDLNAKKNSGSVE